MTRLGVRRIAALDRLMFEGQLRSMMCRLATLVVAGVHLPKWALRTYRE